MKIMFVAWARYHRRSELLSDHLGATVHFIYEEHLVRLWQTPVRYLVQFCQTWCLLRREDPDVVLVQNPPIFCVLVVALYAWLFDARYVIDSHTGSFVSPKWRWSTGLHRWLSRRALTIIVHNRSQEQVVQDWGCRFMTLGFTPGEYQEGERYPLDGHFNLAVISSFKSDEPVDVLFEAASRLPEVNFYITGDATRIPPTQLANMPNNCYLTGYLPYERYVGLLRGVDVIMALTTQNHTMLMGAVEAVSLGTPLIVSDWPVLRDYFSRGTVYVPNTAEGICEGVSLARLTRTALQRDILILREQLEAEWEWKLAELQDLLSEDQPRSHQPTEAVG